MEDAAVLCGRLSVEWPDPKAVLGESTMSAAMLLDELDDLWPVLDRAIQEVGPGCLWSLRWDVDDRWQVLCVPPLDSAPELLPLQATPGAAERDAWTVASALLDMVVARKPRDLGDAKTMVNLHAGATHGLDAVLHAMLHGGSGWLGTAELIYQTVRGRAAEAVGIRAAAETAVGSGKCRYDPGTDNEDAYAVVRPPSGGIAMIVCDGVTGDGDGSGWQASHAAVRELADLLSAGEDPGRAMSSAHRAVQRATSGATTALVAVIANDGRAQLWSIGDSPAWLVRRDDENRCVAFRLTPDHTVLAEEHLDDPDAVHGGSQLARYLGGGPETAEPYCDAIGVAPGDLVVLLSDGAAVSESGWFGSELAVLAEQYPSAPVLAAALTARAERLGGHDNATAVIAEISAQSSLSRTVS